jgi:hypothetical protein
MKETWFHTDCTTEQADELLAQYRRRGVPSSVALTRFHHMDGQRQAAGR